MWICSNMLKIIPRNSLKDHKKIKRFSSIVKDKLNSESRNVKKINTFTFEELSDLNKILTISDFDKPRRSTFKFLPFLETKLLYLNLSSTSFVN